MLTNEHNPQQSLFEGHGQQSVVLPQIPQVSGVPAQSQSALSNLSGEGSHAGIQLPDGKFCEMCGRQFFSTAPSEHPGRFLLRRFCSKACAGKNSPHPSIPDAERFWPNVPSREEGKCWEWVGAIHQSGYGWFKPYHRLPTRAHRISYELTHGSIPEGLWVLHTCDNRKCVNPAHLYAGTVKENSRDAVERDRHARGERNHTAKLTAEQAIELRALAASGVPHAELSARFGITQGRVSTIASGKGWKHLPDVCRSRHGGNAQSEAANAKVAPAKKGMRVAILTALAASDGLTLKELASRFNKQLNQISGRVTELLADQLIERTSAERDGCAVLRTKGTL